MTAVERVRARLEASRNASETVAPISPPAPTPTPPPIAPNAWQRSSTPDIGPIMPIDAITYIQAAFWDNSDKPKTYFCNRTKKTRKRNGPFHKVSLTAWTDPADKIIKNKAGVAFSRNIQIRPVTRFEDTVLDKNVKTGHITAAYEAELKSVLMRSNLNEDFIGVILDKDTEGRWTYHQHQFVHVRWDNALPVVDLYVNGTVLTIDTFKDDLLSDKQRESGVKATAHFDRCGYDTRNISDKDCEDDDA